MRLTEAQQIEFNELTEPLKKWMKKNCDPYESIVVEKDDASLMGIEYNNYNPEP